MAAQEWLLYATYHFEMNAKFALIKKEWNTLQVMNIQYIEVVTNSTQSIYTAASHILHLLKCRTFYFLSRAENSFRHYGAQGKEISEVPSTSQTLASTTEVKRTNCLCTGS